MIVEHPPIIGIVARYANLRRSGKELIGCCPLHDDRHPSLMVNPEKDLWYCPPCGGGGDVFTFLQKVEGLAFPQALAHLGLSETNSVAKGRKVITVSTGGS